MIRKPEKLIEGNRKWVERIKREKPDFFDKLANEQRPEILWIGCSDSRVPATEITDMLPGSIFVHRNVANLVVHTDTNAMSVIYFAVKVLKVQHIIVCGHYNCGGVNAALSDFNTPFMNKWLRNIKDTYLNFKGEVDNITDLTQKRNRMVELNVIQQVHNLSKISFIQEEWQEGESPFIHGWVYGVGDGIIKDLNVSVNDVSHLDPIYHYYKKS